jgi:hypothetical protein
MFSITDQHEVQYNGRTIIVCDNESVALQTAINMSHKYAELAEFQIEEILFSNK